ncbi:MAG: hypothetical protein L3K19_00710 [Thermoplasmata archaeon]|nr:hypothetical protein [Thermoplasmata archaeon]
MDNGETHSGAHGPTLLNFEGKEISPTCFEATCEVLRAGKWRWSKSRHSAYPPLCKVSEHLEGDHARTTFLIQYWPVGKRTGVDVWARLRSDVLSAQKLRARWRESFLNAYDQDIVVLPRFLSQRKKG